MPPLSTSEKASLRELAEQQLTEFSANHGGPFFRLLQRLGLAGDEKEFLAKRTIVIVTLMWLPLLILSMAEGLLTEGTLIPFLYDIEAHVRFLIAVPLILYTDTVAKRLLGPIMQQFILRDLIPDDCLPDFVQAQGGLLKRRNSAVPEICMFILVYAVGVYVMSQMLDYAGGGTSFQRHTSTGVQTTWSGYWYSYFSVPLAQFLLLRWYFRCLNWAYFLWQVSRIKMNLLASAPDGVGGLGFLSISTVAAIPCLVAHGALAAAMIANQVLFHGDQLMQYADLLGALVFVLLVLILAPLLAFTPQLIDARIKGVCQYGELAQRFTLKYTNKWLGPVSPEDDILASPDIQSLSNVASVYSVVDGMQPLVFTRSNVLMLLAAIIIPTLPLALTMVSLNELFKILVSTVF